MFWKKKPEPPAQPPSQPAPPREPMPLGKGQPGVFDRPKNSLEETLMAYRARQVDAQQFIVALFNSDVYILPSAQDLAAGAMQGDKPTLSKSPTLFCLTYPEYSALAIYTSPERAKPTSDLHPEFRYASKVHAGEFLLGLTGSFGLVINPYWDVNLELNNQQVARVLAMMERE